MGLLRNTAKTEIRQVLDKTADMVLPARARRSAAAETATLVSPVRVTPATRHFTASAVVFDVAARRVLLVEHVLTGRRQFPGGHVDPDEDGAQCALREVLEETGVAAGLYAPDAVDVRYGQWLPAPFMLAEHPAPADPHKGTPAHRHLDMLYVATADSTAPTVAQLAEVNAAVWLSVDDIGRCDVRADVPVLVPLTWSYLTGETL